MPGALAYTYHGYAGREAVASGEGLIQHIMLEELPNRLAELSGYEERLIILVCRTDRRSGKAAQILAHEGFADVHVAKGGMTD